ncbi:MAG: translation elongation factor Ts [Fimbriimonadaceae bacterium]|nr:translation elongation factor Ts [Fimbriimonadaceae bacterium]
MAINAADVKRLRDLTDAPMMECKAALEEAGGDFERAKQILREKGAAAASKRTDRATNAGIAKFVTSSDGKQAVGIVVETETDFVALNPTFRELVDKIANGLLAYSVEEVNSKANDLTIDGQPVADLLEQAVAVIRENIRLTKAVKIESNGQIAVYNHRTGDAESTQCAAVDASGDAGNVKDVAFKVAVQVVAGKPEFLKRDDVSADMIAQEIATETTRAINDGKPAEMAAKIAEGRVNKEFFKSQVLMEQPFFEDPTKSTGQWVSEAASGGKIEITQYVRLVVGG